jgi:hypothetical protein
LDSARTHHAKAINPATTLDATRAKVIAQEH